jgi:hypothetical protein
MLGGIVARRLFYVLEHGGPLLATRGFTFDGGMVLAGVLIAGYVWRSRLSGTYLDAVAVGLPLGKPRRPDGRPRHAQRRLRPAVAATQEYAPALAAGLTTSRW